MCSKNPRSVLHAQGDVRCIAMKMSGAAVIANTRRGMTTSHLIFFSFLKNAQTPAAPAPSMSNNPMK